MSRAGLKFIKQSLENETDDCIVYPFAIQNNTGYGRIKYNGKHTQAHRVSLILSEGLPPEGKPYALHAPDVCHNKACINKRHLRWGSPTDNLNDRYIDGTDRRGIKHPMARLNEKQVIEIYQSQKCQHDLARIYGVGERAISKIKTGTRWGHLTSCL